MKRALIVLVLMACDEGRVQPPFVRSDVGVRAGDDGAVTDDASVRADAAMRRDSSFTPFDDDAAVVAAPDGGMRCPPGFVLNGTMCVANVPGNPALHTRDEVCAAFRMGHIENASNGGFSKSNAMCDPGSVSRDGLDDALRRLTFQRWLAGIGPATESESAHTRAQACALIAAWNPVGPQAHSPAPSAECYTAEGAGAAGQSNIAWGNGTAAQAIDQWMEDNGNDTTFGHRRWMLNPPLSDVGIGAYVGGNNYGSSSCLSVFGSGGSSTGPAMIAYPPPGFVPDVLARQVWTLQGQVPTSNLAITVRSNGAVLPTAIAVLNGNYGNSSGLRIDRMGWNPMRDQTYEVEVTGDGVAPIQFSMTPISCPP